MNQPFLLRTSPVFFLLLGCLEYNIGLPGATLPGVKTLYFDSVLQCQEACIEKAGVGCKFFIYWYKNWVCYLRGSDSGRKTRTGAIAGRVDLCTPTSK